MKLKKGKVEIEFDAEKLVEKSIEKHDKNWKEKFKVKHNAKKEMLEIRHKQKMERQEKKRE